MTLTMLLRRKENKTTLYIPDINKNVKPLKSYHPFAVHLDYADRIFPETSKKIINKLPPEANAFEIARSSKFFRKGKKIEYAVIPYLIKKYFNGFVVIY